MWTVFEYFDAKDGEHFPIGCKLHTFSEKRANEYADFLNENEPEANHFDVLFSDNTERCDFCNMHASVAHLGDERASWQVVVLGPFQPEKEDFPNGLPY